jgi:hypothetical protein
MLKKGTVYGIFIILITLAVLPVEGSINDNKTLRDTSTNLGYSAQKIIDINYIFQDIWQEEAKLSASDNEFLDSFGHSVSIDGDYALIGAPNDNNFQGSAYVFKHNGTTWTEDTKLTASDGIPSDIFGISVAINGNYTLIGASTCDEYRKSNAGLGSAYIFSHDGTTWTEKIKLIASDGEIDNFFGFSVAFDGNYALIGAPGDDNFQGAVYVFSYDGSTWIEETKLTASDGAYGEFFGNSISFYENYALIGAPDLFNDEIGSAYVFKSDDTTWTEEAKLTASDGQAGDWFGYSVSINDDYAIIGASEPWEDGLGAAYVFSRDGTTWAEETKLTASDGESRDWFGESVVIIGNYAFIGAYGDDNNQGSTYIFKRDGTIWTEEAKLTASDPQPYDAFGRSISISRNYLLIGAFGDNDYNGSAYVFFTPPADLVCEGSLTWENVKPGDIVTGEFEILNDGEPDSYMNWIIKSCPEWGIWTFNPESGTGLSKGESVTVNVDVVAPNKQNTTFEGEIVIVNAFNPDDTCTIQVSLITPYNNSPVLILPRFLMDRFPILDRLLNIGWWNVE